MKPNLEMYNTNRLEYINVSWKSKNGVTTKITELDDSYLLNIMRNVSKSLILAGHFPDVKEFQFYEGVSYKKWQKFLINEYKFRNEIVEQRYNEYLDQQIYEQSVRDREYYDDRYDYKALGDCF